MRNTKFLGTVEAAAVLLFLLQSVRVLFSVLFGLIYDAIFEEIIPLTVVGGILAIVIVACLTRRPPGVVPAGVQIAIRGVRFHRELRSDVGF